MNTYCTIQIYHHQQWHDCAIVEILDASSLGWEAKTRTAYLFEYAISHMDAQDAHALSYHFPVNVQSSTCDTWPAFLVDLLPQVRNYCANWIIQKMRNKKLIGHY